MSPVWPVPLDVVVYLITALPGLHLDADTISGEVVGPDTTQTRKQSSRESLAQTGSVSQCLCPTKQHSGELSI